VQAALIFSPWIPFQRRLFTGLQLPLVVLAVYGWPVLWAWVARRRPAVAAAFTHPLVPALGVLALFGFTNLTNLANEVGLMAERNPLMFWPRDQLVAIAAVRGFTDANSVILANPNTSYLIPGLTGRRVVAGHGIETLDLEAKQVAVAWFYQGGSSAGRRALLDRYRVTHVFAGAREVDGDWSSLEALPFLQEVWRNDVARLYRVER